MAKDSRPKDWETLNNRCLGLAFTGYAEEAIQVGVKAVEAAINCFGENNPNVAECLKNLGIAYLYNRDYNLAENMLRRAVAIAEATLDSDRNDISEYIHQLGVVVHAQGKYEEAEKLYKRGLIIRENIYGQQHQIIAKSLGDLARLYLDNGGDFKDTEALLLRSKSILEKRIDGAQEPRDELDEALFDLSVLTNNLGSNYRRQNRMDEAESYLMRSLDLLEQFYDRGNKPTPAFVQTLINNLAALYTQQGKDIDSDREFNLLLNRASKILDLDDGEADNELQTEQQFWQTLKQQLQKLQQKRRLDDMAIAQALSYMFKNKVLPEMFQEPAELQDVIIGFAERTYKSNLIAYTPMSMDLIIAGHKSLSETLDNLGEIYIVGVLKPEE
jgi:tetratricopeptide (TPR) repeat protein